MAKKIVWDERHSFSVSKVTEGGRGVVQYIRDLKDAGIRAKQSHSPYVGQSGLVIEMGKIREAEDIIHTGGW